MSITVGMGGYDGSCNGKYANASWMERCIASRRDHRGAVIAYFDEEEPWKATFIYKNSIANETVEDEFTLVSQLPGWNIGNTPAPSLPLPPSDAPLQVSEEPPSDAPLQESNTSEQATSWAFRSSTVPFHSIIVIMLLALF
jgi:hypothetical protein